MGTMRGFLLWNVLTVCSGAQPALIDEMQLPAINVKFDSPLRDLGVGGPMQAASEDVLAFKQRSSRILHSLEKDAAVATEFYQTTARNLNLLTGALRGKVVKAKL